VVAARPPGAGLTMKPLSLLTGGRLAKFDVSSKAKHSGRPENVGGA
jgi:hypothetical protein